MPIKKSKFTEAQIVFALKQNETGVSVEEVCRKLGITQATFYNWKKKFGGLGIGGNLNLGYGTWSDGAFKPSLVGASIGIGDTVGVAWVTGETKAGWWPFMDLH